MYSCFPMNLDSDKSLNSKFIGKQLWSNCNVICKLLYSCFPMNLEMTTLIYHFNRSFDIL